VGHPGSFGYWVRRQRKTLDLTQAELARKVSCSTSMLRKIERDERRPSELLAELLADHLAIEESQRAPFLRMARGIFVPDAYPSNQASDMQMPELAEIAEQEEEQAPFVARQRELQILHKHLDKAMDGQGQIVFIAGEAGRGKTSLLYAFANKAMDAWPNLIVAGGSSDVYTGRGDPLLPFRDIFRLLAGDIENASMRGIINRRLARRLARAIPVAAKVLLDHGPLLIETLVPGAVLEARLAQSYPQHSMDVKLLLRLQDQRARRSLSPVHELRQDWLFAQISTTLKALAQRMPLLLMLDDLHWVDQSSAALLGHLARRLKQSPILIIGSYRPEDLAQRQSANEGEGDQVPHPLREVLSESLRQFGQNRIDLDHSEPREERDFVDALLDACDNDFGDQFRENLTRLTEGQPLFVVELLRDMRERGDIIRRGDGRWTESKTISWEGLPARVEGVIEKRINRLPDDQRDLLVAGSVQGEIFSAEVVARVRQTDAGQLTRQLSANLDRQHLLIKEQGVKHAGRRRLSQFRFRHQLFQRYLYGRLTAAERMYLHQAVGNALEALYANGVEAEDLPATQLARHFEEAHQIAKASRYLLLAGQNATVMLAYDEAAKHFERGLLMLENENRTSEINRLTFDLSLALARVYWRAGYVADAISAFEKTIEIARATNDPNVLGRAVLAYEGPRWRLNLDPELSQQFIREALAALVEEESGLRVRLLVSLSHALLASGEQEELRIAVDHALQMARRIEDPVALYDAINIRIHIDRSPETTSNRLANVQEMMVTAEAIGDQERLADALDLYVYDMLELGHIDLVDKTIALHKKIAEEMRQPFQLHIAGVFQTMRAIMRGEFKVAERLANRAADLSRQIGLAELDGILGVHMFTIRWEQGRLNGVAPIVNLLVSNNPASTSWRPGLALIYRLLGNREACKNIFEELAADGFALVPRDSIWVATLAYLTEICSFLGDVDRAATLYKLLAPYEGRAVVVGGATACYGAAGRYLGLLAKTMSDWKSAEHHFEEALNLDAHMRAWPWLAHGRYEYAAMLLLRGREADRQRAIALLDEALTAGRQMEMTYLVEKVSNLKVKYQLDRAN
jgi:transcriptional regulator with XRE-family HTH domain/tetratricopeptide (TPR) repeat protein